MDTVWVLVSAAVGIGFVHTLIGIDHTLPFVVLGKARGWSLRRTLWITGLCGGGHVASSVLLGGAGIGLAIFATGLNLEEGHHWMAGRVGVFESIEAVRGDLAAWALVAFGLTYAAWSLARRRRQQRHVHEHTDGLVHSHDHPDAGGHEHSNGPAPGIAGLTAWSLFVIFVLGPCEPLIPILMVPAFQVGLWAVAPVTLAFAVTTIATMAGVVALAYRGLDFVRFPRLRAHVHTLSGLAIASSGLAMMLFAI
ncbi:MAG: hypothetical protein F4210_14105 [Holophagales bacterium]|nr:hypothetical protein [Holophagales bacterium]MYF96614.1 hypothetical protein [Holophagales bacterium]